MQPTAAYVGLGANLGDPVRALRVAADTLRCLPGTSLTAISSLYLSAPIDASGDDFVNAVAKLDTMLTAHALLRALQKIETDHGRQRPFRNAPRTLDLDLLLHGESVIEEPELTLPHPRMTSRAFVLLPLLEIAPKITIPGHGSAASYLAQVQDQAIRKMPAVKA